MELKLYIRHLQRFDIHGNAIIYTGANPQSLKVIRGTVPQTAWLDVTGDCSNIEKVKITFSIDRADTGESVPGAFQPKKAVSDTVQIEGAAYQFIRAWCIDNVAAPLNGIDVKIVDTSCGEYLGFYIKSTNITWCEDGLCEFDVTFKQQDTELQCVEKTLIADNWQHWFDKEPLNKKHPRFSYCNEIRPNATLIVMWFLIRTFADIAFVLGFIVGLVINALIPIINSIIFIINIIDAIFGSGHVDYIQFVDPFNMFGDYFMNLYIEAAGCGREHPAPLIRDYILNVCGKCGLKVDAATAPIFFAQQISLQASTRTLNNVKNPHYNACYMTPILVRGIRRYRTNSIFSGATMNTTEFYIPDNEPLETLSDMLDKLKTLYNAEWRVTNGTLYFWRKDWFISGSYIYDFTENSADRNKIIEGICFEWNELKYFAASKGIYTTDAADTCGNEALRQMNGWAKYGDTDENPNFEGIQDRTTPHFGGTKFRLDGASTDYIYDAMQVIVNGQVLQISTIQQMKDLATWLGKYADYALLMKDETCTLNKVIIWDGESYLNAKAVRDVVPIGNYLVPSSPTPQINPDYNAFVFPGGVPSYETWAQRHLPENHVQGSAWVPGGVPTGIYEVGDYVGSLVMHAAARLPNYPMYYEPGYLDTLWDWFHWIDDPRKNPRLNMNWRVKIENCCADLKLLKVLDTAGDIRLGYKVKMPVKYFPDGIIREITVCYDSSYKYGKYIELKGTV